MPEQLTKEQTKERIKALLYEREGYEKYGNTASVKLVDEQLKLLGHNAKPPAKRATKMTAKKGTEL